MVAAIVILAFVIFGLMALAGFVDIKKLNKIGRKVVTIDVCDDCNHVRELYHGPYDNLICDKCIIEFAKEQRRRDETV
jgi:hypothetical protein